MIDKSPKTATAIFNESGIINSSLSMKKIAIKISKSSVTIILV